MRCPQLVHGRSCGPPDVRDCAAELDGSRRREQCRVMARTTRHLKAGEAGTGEAASMLRDGALVAFPTETVYGLGADATNGRAVAGIYEAKGRPSFNPLIAHVPDVAAAERQGVFSAQADRLARA